MQDWTDVHTKDELAKRYASYIPSLQKIAGQCGYALAVHGSMKRDLDLIAVPWVKKAMTAESLVLMLQEATNGYSYSRNYWKKQADSDPKPFGRRAYIINWANIADDFEGKSLGYQQRHAIIDLSVMPRLNP